jgi:hypothetical protein
MSAVTRKKPKYVSAYLIVFFAFAYRIWQLDIRSLWFDEAVEYLTASVDTLALPTAIVTLNYQPPLFSYLLHFWLNIGIDPFILRMLPVLISLLTLVVLMRWSANIFGPTSMWRVGLVTAASPTELYYSQDLGEYSLLVFLISTTLMLLSSVAKHNKLRTSILAGLFGVLAIYTHYGAVLIIIPLNIALLLHLTWRDPRFFWRQCIIGIAMIISLLPLVWSYLPYQFGRRTEQISVAPFSFSFSEFYEFGSTIMKTLGFPLTGIGYLEFSIWPVAIILGGLLLLIITSRKHSSHLIFGWFVLSFSAYYMALRIGYYPSGGTRYGLIFMPFLMVMFGLSSNSTTWRSWLVIGMTLFACGLGLYTSPNISMSQTLRQSATWAPQEEMHESMTYWLEHRKKGQKTLIYYSAVPAFRYYAELLGLDDQWAEDELQPVCTSLSQTSNCQRQNLYYSTWIRHLSNEEKRAYTEELLGGFPSEFWLLVSHGTALEIIEPIGDLYEVERELETVNASATLLRKKLIDAEK